ncbi:hypothetical protein SCT_0701 [Sulfuricella sp. T08]|uniref:restriction endonuclease subunit S n=1 Tax=Sulfuricella sp. T08 TaxID=1632857 RepID=UPI0006179E56|nr:restriction endonuclease subunit S [Sulfuricella sp. T08]GAO35316.1 hypothetical protein SCT_0701 [Sulfuricella sp. T08]
MSLPRYPEYKDSGVEWLGEVPGHWEVRRFKQVFKERDERSGCGTETLLSVSAYTGVSPRSEIVDAGDHLSRAESLEGYKICHPDDLVMNIMLAWNRGLAFSSYNGIVSPAYCVFHVIDGSAPIFLNYLVRTDLYTLYFKAFSSGVIDSRLRLYPDVFGSLSCTLPLLAEQHTIAAFLDRETGKIDALIAEQQRLVELLAEKRQAVISHAVTKGLNPNAPMKDSGIEWLGEVPAHWEVRRVKDVARLESGHTPSKQVPAYWEDCDIPWVSLNDSKQLAVCDYISETAVQINHLGLTNSSARMLPGGAVVFTRDATIGLTAITTRPMAVSQHLIAWCPSEKIDALFLLRVFNTMKLFLDACTFGATIKTIGMADVKKLVTPVPPIPEQQAIVAFLENEVAKFDALTTEANRTIALLQERRSALISAAVTGKIDVRGLALS